MENKSLASLESKSKDDSTIDSSSNSISAIALAAASALSSNSTTNTSSNTSTNSSTNSSSITSNPSSNLSSNPFPFYNLRQYETDHTSTLASIASNPYNTNRFGLEELRNYSMIPQLQNHMITSPYLLNPTTSASDQQSLESLSQMVLFSQMASNLNNMHSASSDGTSATGSSVYPGGFDPNSIFGNSESAHHLMYPMSNLSQQQQFSNFPFSMLNSSMNPSNEIPSANSIIEHANSIYPIGLPVNMDYFFPDNSLHQFNFFPHDLQYQVVKNNELLNTVVKRSLNTSDSLNTTSSESSTNNTSSTASAHGMSTEQIYLNNMKKKYEWLVVEGGDIPNSPDADAQKKFKKMHCSYCKEHNQSCAWAYPRLRKVDIDIAHDHDKSPLHKNYRNTTDSDKLSWDSISFNKEIDSRKRSLNDIDFDKSGDPSIKRQKSKFSPEWLEAEGPLRYSNQQLASGKDLSKEKRKYKLLRCKLCAKFLPDSQWAVMRPRKHEIQVFVEHERSCNHRKAIENSKKILAK